MKVQMLRNPAKDLGCSLKEGETGEVSQSTGERLVAFGLAVCLDDVDSKRIVKAVPTEPELSVAKPSEISGGESDSSDFDEPPATAKKKSGKSSAK